MGNGSIFDENLLKTDYSPIIYAYYYKQWNEFHMAFHQHDSTEIMYVIQGDCLVEWDGGTGGREKVVKLKKGEFILLDANVPHRLIVENTCRMLNVEFGFSDHSGYVPSIKQLAAEEEPLRAMISAPTSYLMLIDPDDVYHLLKSLALELDHRGSDGGVLDRMLMSQLLIRISRLRRETENNASHQVEQYVKQSIEFMHQNYDRSIRVNEMAAHVSLHPGYLQRIFKTHSGQTLMEYLTAVRMEKAKMLLQQTDIPIADISDYVGAGSRQYFHALFKKHTKQTPIEFRNSINTHRFLDKGENI
ncbi:AraC family transcriptional regulator [Cohnella silvisoli]|uniref:AraC family transcriptional regulator n=1 Tax=Cohnella silvisoli TaxID=2873699 RepID=A0ABV1KSU3_9BACL|nr:AraC family transcriptional regulator [Cohnella silvisoli]MCD9021437.1 AraC family transcriptional regulator [Cohnella silvisoli]